MKEQAKYLANLNISEAIALAKEGYLIYREGWNGKNIYVYYSIPATIDSTVIAQLNSLPGAAKRLLVENQSIEKVCFENQMHLIKPNGTIVGWSPSTEDAVSTDWCAKNETAIMHQNILRRSE